MKKIIQTCRKRLVLYFALLLLATVFSTMFSFSLAAIMNTAVERDKAALLHAVGYTAVVLVLSQIFDYLCAVTKNGVAKQWNIRLKEAVFGRIMDKPLREFEQRDSAAYINRLTADCELMDQYYFENCFTLFEASAQFLVVAVSVVAASPLLFAVMLLLTAVTVALMNAGGGRLSEAASAYAVERETYCGAVKENISNFMLVKLYCIAENVKRSFGAVNASVGEKACAQKNLYARKNALAQFAGLFSTLAVMGVSAYLAIGGAVSAGFVIVAGQLIGKIVYPVTIFPNILMNFQSAKPIAERLDLGENGGEKERNGEGLNRVDEIRFRGVSFSYPGEERLALKGISHTFSSGKKYLIVGKNGCGKSTLLRLMAGCDATYGGSILVNGKEMRDYGEAELFGRIGFMTQESYMWNATLRENLALCGEFPDEEMEDCLKRAGVSDWKKVFPEGLDTRISESGNNFSSGEKQKIALARVLLHKFSWLLFDEFTASLDAATAAQLEERLLRIEDATIVVVSHRTSGEIMSKYDEVVVMKDGMIAERSTT